MAVIDNATAPQSQVMGNLSSDDIFENAQRLFVRQEVAAIEVCGIEAKQRYRISQTDESNKEGKVFLFITEESQCLERICCSTNRSLKLLVHQGQDKDGPVVQTMEKPFSLQGCCCCRPSFDVKAGPTQVGFVQDPCRFCWMDQQVLNANREVSFITQGSPCQCGMFCPCCAGINFNVKKPFGGDKVGSITKLPMDIMECAFGANRFVIDMAGVTDPVERRMMLASAMLLDLAYFEQQK